MLAKIIRYKVTVASVKRRSFSNYDSEVTINDQDCFFGYSYENHRVGKFFDLWFTNPKEKDPDNYITFGRIFDIQRISAIGGYLYITKFGKFYVEEYDDAAKRTIPEHSKHAKFLMATTRQKSNTGHSSIYSHGGKVVPETLSIRVGDGEIVGIRPKRSYS